MEMEIEKIIEYLNTLKSDEKHDLIQQILSHQLPARVSVSLVTIVAYSTYDRL